jgi:hypothetical protein
MQTALLPNAQRARIAIIMIWVVLGSQIVSCISDFLQLMLLTTVLNGNDYDMATLDANDTRQTIIAVLNFGLLIASAVTFIQWFRRAYYNLHIMENNLRFTEGWASGAWFVPSFPCLDPTKSWPKCFMLRGRYWCATCRIFNQKNIQLCSGFGGPCG